MQQSKVEGDDTHKKKDGVGGGDDIYGQWRCEREHWELLVSEIVTNFKQPHGRWKSWSNLELISWKPDEATLMKTEKQGAVLRLPSVKSGKQGTVLRFPKATLRQHEETLELETYIWRPPWLGEGAEHTTMERHVEIERVKRKPPWRIVASE